MSRNAFFPEIPVSGSTHYCILFLFLGLSFEAYFAYLKKISIVYRCPQMYFFKWLLRILIETIFVLKLFLKEGNVNIRL